MKACIICDNLLKDQKYECILNHYLCSEVCSVYYSNCIKWNDELDRFDVNIFNLNDIRKETFGIDGISMDEIDKRIDT